MMQTVLERTSGETTLIQQSAIPVTTQNYARPKLYLFVKRMFDIVVSLCALILLSPVFLIIAWLIKTKDGGPAIHTRLCKGKDGNTYKMYKFRSMVMDADNLERWLSPEQLKTYLAECKLDNDPRITPVGRFLRKTSLDELPQLVSVLKGDMSLVGPRPVVDVEMKNYSQHELQILLESKPGITGYWQVNGRSDSTYESGKRQEMELYYVAHCSLLFDLKILFKTVLVVLRGKGAK